MSSQNGTTKKKPVTKPVTDEKKKADTAVKALVKDALKPKVSSHAEIVKRRMDRRTKLSTLYKDIDALEKAQSDFDSIQSFGDIRIVVHSGTTPTFATTRQDTIESVLKAIQGNISKKLVQAQTELAEFEF